MRLLFEGGDYSRAASDQGNTVTSVKKNFFSRGHFQLAMGP